MRFLSNRGITAAKHKKREVLLMVEHQEINLPLDIIKPDGSFDLYEDIQSRFQIEYKAKYKKLIIRGSRWIGHVPINDRYALSIDTRMPVSNIERILSRSPFKIAETIRYTHSYLSTSIRAQSLFDVLTDQFLDTLDIIRHDGLIKNYRREQRISPSPTGRIDPLRTSYISHFFGKISAVYSTYTRTEDTLENQIIRFALECLQSHYYTMHESSNYISRLSRISNHYMHFKNVSLPNKSNITSDSLALTISKLPIHKDSYADTLRLAQLIVSGQSISLRGEGGLAILPSILVDMSEIFEGYVRDVLANKFSNPNVSVLDGNKAAPTGAALPLFSTFFVRGTSPNATPDIVVNDKSTTKLIIDVKYKPVKKLPDRADINQIICYAQRYNAPKVMLLYPASSHNDIPVTLLGTIGDISVYIGLFNLSAHDLPAEEVHFTKAIEGLTI